MTIYSPTHAAVQSMLDSTALDAVTPDMDAALKMLRKLVKAGVEYPDAHTQVALKFKLKRKQADELADMYDDSAFDSVGYQADVTINGKDMKLSLGGKPQKAVQDWCKENDVDFKAAEIFIANHPEKGRFLEKRKGFTQLSAGG